MRFSFRMAVGALAALGLSACDDWIPGVHCTVTEDCSGEATCEEGLCIETNACSPACGEREICVERVCNPSYAAEIVAPAEGAKVGRQVAVTARFVRAPGAVAEAPASLVLEIAGPGGGTLSTAALSLAGDDQYAGTWTPGAEGQHQLVAVGATPWETRSLPTSVRVDLTPPEVAISFEFPARPSATATTAHQDPGLTGGYYRRDEEAVVVVSSSDDDVAETSIELGVSGTTGARKAFPLSADTPASCPVSARTCRMARVPLWDPALEMRAFRGEFGVVVRVSDDVGNAVDVPETFPVTRWKWSFQTTGQIRVAPTLGGGGLVFVADTSLAGRVFAIRPTGAGAWTFETGSAVDASPVVGRVGQQEHLFVAGVANSKGAIWALPTSSTPGAVGATCSAGTAIRSSIAYVDTPIPSVLAVAADAAGARLLAAQFPSSASTQCPTLDVSTTVDESSGLAIDEAGVYFGDTQGFVHGYTFSVQTGQWLKKDAWPVLVGDGNRPTNPIIVGAGVAGGGGVGVGRIFKIPFTGGTASGVSTGSPTYNAVESSSHKIIAGDESGKLHFVKEDLTGGENWVQLDGSVVAAPAIGRDQTLHVATLAGTLYALDEAGATLWSAPLGAQSTSSPALDCARDEAGRAVPRAGVVYVGADDGKLYAFVTDSRGLDVDAPWPKFHRDPANTADASANLSPYACP